MMCGIRRVVGAVAILAAVAPQLVAGPAEAATSLAATVDVPAVLTVGAADTIFVDVVNTSSPPGPITVTGLRFVPACSSVGDGCQTVDPGHLADDGRVIAFHSLLEAIPDCTGASFTASEPTPGVVQLTGTLTLAAGATCRFAAAVEAITTPLVDARSAMAGVQTTSVVEVTTSTGARAVGLDTVTVEKYTPMIVIGADPLVTAGSPLLARGNVFRASVRPGDSVTFRLFTDAACTNQVLESVVPIPEVNFAEARYPYASVGTYRWTVAYSGDGSNNAQATACGDPELTQTVVPGGTFSATSPTRIEDTRLGTGGLTGPLGPGATADVQVTGRGIPLNGVSAVVLNVTVTEPTAGGWLTLYPAGTARPLASNLNFSPGETIPNLVVVKVGAGGRVSLFNAAGSTHVVLDVAGWYADVPWQAGGYHAVSPSRLADSRIGQGGAVRLGPGESFDVQVAGRGGVPQSGVRAATLNVGAVDATAASFLTVYPTGEPRPWASNVNVTAGGTASNRTMTKLGTSGMVTIYNAAGFADFIVDVGGWYDTENGDRIPAYAPLEPSRILDTRTGTGGIAGPLAAGTHVDVAIAGRSGVPALGVSAVVLNVTVTEPAAAGWLSLSPISPSSPTTSDLNFAAGETRPNLVVVGRDGWSGALDLYTSARAHVVIDVAGYFT